jgi:hypothetical protein
MITNRDHSARLNFTLTTVGESEAAVQVTFMRAWPTSDIDGGKRFWQPTSTSRLSNVTSGI